MARLRIATRASAQAWTQAEVVARSIERACPGLTLELVAVETTGDRRLDVPLHEIGGQGVFVKEVQRAVLDGRAELAVHSAKDLPSTPAPGLVIGAFCPRRDPRDALVGRSLDALGPGAVVATGSVRRRAQLAELRPDLRFVELRGNIASRLAKVPDEGAIVMAVAALEVLGLTEHLAEVLEPDRMVPAVGQGCVAVECRIGDALASEALAAVDHAPTRADVELERAYLAELGSGCSLPVGFHAAGADSWRFLAGPRGSVRGRAIRPSTTDAARAMARADHQGVAGP